MDRSISILKFLKYTIAFVFLTSGLMKLVHTELADYFMNLGIPFPLEVMYIVAWIEIGCGALLLLNKYTKLATIALMAVMIGAIILTKLPVLNSGVIHALFNARLDIVMLILLAVLYRNRVIIIKKTP
ncbi:DoxX family protein [Halobacillus sp. A1]|uniref:DoxX family protein n=1 Tax=Halobacillus sp. A1 TaxID=2880262 RepID=UPI0020A63ABA|nr:DoxX family protein [Halobacillus sp. A1]MCP3030834.1 DoxX family protein [Halobacillus sp. A1]